VRHDGKKEAGPNQPGQVRQGDKGVLKPLAEGEALEDRALADIMARILGCAKIPLDDP
jgi:hypothetical protein